MWFIELVFQPKFLVTALVLLIFIIGLSIGLPLVTKKNNNDFLEDTTENPESTFDPNETTSDSLETSPSDATEPTSIATEDPLKAKVVKKQVWEEEGLPLEGKYKQLTPIQKVIVMTTKTDPCFNLVKNILKLFACNNLKMLDKLH